MKNKDRFYDAFIANNGQLNEIELGETIGLTEVETQALIVQLLAEHKIIYQENRNSNYKRN